MQEMQWLLLSYKIKTIIKPRQKEGDIRFFDINTKEINIYILKSKIKKSDLSALQSEISDCIKSPLRKYGLIVFPSELLRVIKEIIQQVSGEIDFVNAKEKEISEAADNFLDFLSDINQSKIKKAQLTVKGFQINPKSVSLTKFSVSRKEKKMDTNQLLSTFSKAWDFGGRHRRVLIYSYAISSGLLKQQTSILSEISEQMGISKGKVKDIIKDLIEKEMMEQSYSGFIRTENGAYDFVKKVVEENYGLHDLIKYNYKEKIVKEEGLKLLTASHDGKHPDKFAAMVRSVFTNFLTDIKEINVESDLHIKHSMKVFDLYIENEWYIILSCISKKKHLELEDVAMMDMIRESEVKRHSGYQIFDLLCGSSFSDTAESYAISHNVHLADILSILRLNKFFSSLSVGQLKKVEKNISLLFTKEGGYIDISSGISRLNSVK